VGEDLAAELASGGGDHNSRDRSEDD
jgi:hypothetical protein